MIYIGIDGGFSGGISCLLDNGNGVLTYAMPIINGKKKEYDVPAIVGLFSKIKDYADTRNHNISVMLEETEYKRGQTNYRAIKTTNFCVGVFQGVLTSLQIPFQMVRASEWQKVVLKGMNREDTKAASIMFCQRKYPKHDFKPTERCTKISDGLTDATCMAYYAYLLHNKGD